MLRRRRRAATAGLDINPSAGVAFDLVRLFRDEGVPFVFVTGCDGRLIPVAFASVAWPQKPIKRPLRPPPPPAPA